MNSTSKFESVWDALVDDPDEDLKRKADYSILIQARLHGQSGKVESISRTTALFLATIP
jgi:hypothetical protein